MITFGVDAHKRTHTVVAIDDRGIPLGQTTIGTTSFDHLHLLQWASRIGVERAGRSRTVVTSLGVWNATCSPLGNSSCECRRS